MAVPVSDPLSMALNRELRRSERVAWHGKPLARVSLPSLGIWLFAIPWTTFALIWTAIAAAGAAGMSQEASDGGNWSWLPYVFPLWGVPFILVGLGMLGAPFAPLWTAGRTIFAITNQRLIKLTLWKNLQTNSVPLDRIGVMNRREKRDGSGTLSMTVRIGVDSDGDSKKDNFDIGEVADVMRVEGHVRDLTERYRAERQRAKDARAAIMTHDEFSS